MDVEGLALVDEGRTFQGQVYDLLLTDLPDCLEDVTALLRNFGDALDGAILGDESVSYLRRPEILSGEKCTLEMR